MKMTKAVTAFVAAVIIIGMFFILWFQSTHYIQDSKGTATKGLIFRNTIKLEYYRNISNGFDIYGKYSHYTRSDRQSEFLVVYCRNYCSKDNNSSK